VKNVGEPCAGEPHARFDGRALETDTTGPRRGQRPRETRRDETPHLPAGTAPRQRPTQPTSPWRRTRPHPGHVLPCVRRRRPAQPRRRCPRCWCWRFPSSSTRFPTSAPHRVPDVELTRGEGAGLVDRGSHPAVLRHGALEDGQDVLRTVGSPRCGDRRHSRSARTGTWREHYALTLSTRPPRRATVAERVKSAHLCRQRCHIRSARMPTGSSVR
jgi:hypothetical protein